MKVTNEVCFMFMALDSEIYNLEQMDDKAKKKFLVKISVKSSKAKD